MSRLSGEVPWALGFLNGLSKLLCAGTRGYGVEYVPPEPQRPQTGKAGQREAKLTHYPASQPRHVTRLLDLDPGHQRKIGNRNELNADLTVGHIDVEGFVERHIPSCLRGGKLTVRKT